MCSTRPANSSGIPLFWETERIRSGPLDFSGGRTIKSGVLEKPRRDGIDANSQAGKIARHGERHAHNAAFGRRISGLTDLAVKAAVLATLTMTPRSPFSSGVLADMAKAALLPMLKVPSRFRRTMISKAAQLMRPGSGHRSFRPAGPRAVDAKVDAAVKLLCFGNGFMGIFFARDVALDEAGRRRPTRQPVRGRFLPAHP